MKIKSAEVYGFMGFLGGAALGKSGDITLCFYLSCPEPYTLNEASIQWRQSEYERALKHMPAGSYLLKQDVFVKKEYDPSRHMSSHTFLQEAESRHFVGRLYLEHHCILAFSLSGLESLAPAYEKNPLAFRDDLTEKDKARLADFYDAVDGAVIILKQLPDTSLRLLEPWELKQYMIQYVNGFPGDPGMRDVHFGRQLEIGEASGAAFVICEESYLPAELPVCIEDNTIAKANAALYMAPLEKLGIHLPANHTVNQLVFFEGRQKLKSELQVRADDFHHHRKFAQEVELAAKRLAEMNKEVLENGANLCRGHVSIIVWDKDSTALEASKNTIREVLKVGDFNYYQPSFEGLENLFLGTVIGRQSKLARTYFFMTELSIITGLFIHYGPYRDDEQGILFNDRIFNVPLRLDIWDEAKRRIPARNSMMVAGTGGGKSATSNNILEQEITELLHYKMKAVCVEFGKSFQAITRLYVDRSAHIDYDGNTPLGVNPFFIRSREEITMEKIKTLTVLVLKFWREREVIEDTKQYVSLLKIIRDYYDRKQDGHSFPDFYHYIRDGFPAICERQQIPEEYFNVDSFLHICSEFMPGGAYESVCRMDGSNEDVIREKDLIVFELTRIKKDPFLVSIILTIIFDTVENKILADRSIRGKLYLDEYSETAAMKDNFTGEDVHSTVSFCFQKFRKENGAISAIIQSPAQLPENNFTRSIIANVQLLYVLPTQENVYDDIIKSFRIKNESHIQLMKSIRNNFAGKRPYAEVFIRFGDLYATVVRLEFSPEKFYAFQTDGKDWQALDNLCRSGKTMEEAITQYIKTKEHEKVLV